MLKSVIVFFVSVILTGCFFRSTSDSGMQSIMLRYVYPQPDGEGSIVHKIDTVWFVKSGHTNIFILPGLREIIENDFLNPKILHYRYFIYDDKDSVGFVYDSLSAIKKRPRNVDSFFRNQFYGKVSPLNKQNVKIRRYKDKDENAVEVYGLKEKPDRTYADTSILYYSNKYDKLFYSLSKELDSTSGMKLFKFRFIYNADDPAKFNDPWPAKELFWEIQEDIMLNKKDLLAFIERHKKTAL